MAPLTSKVSDGAAVPIPIEPPIETMVVLINPPVAIPVVTSEAVI